MKALIMILSNDVPSAENKYFLLVTYFMLQGGGGDAGGDKSLRGKNALKIWK